ncbi:hypothetical protein KCP69_03030 [Salmonella enterica subsp. enterica]|nr:hypothetical protein KCP69_03030 [Salmonella enterica subsp. enterica]
MRDTVAMDRHATGTSKTSTGLSPIKTLRLGWATVWPPFAMQSARTWISSPKCNALPTPLAIQFGRMIEELGIFYYEEPVMPLNPAQMKQVADKRQYSTGGWRTAYWRWGYRPFPENGSLSVGSA